MVAGCGWGEEGKGVGAEERMGGGGVTWWGGDVKMPAYHHDEVSARGAGMGGARRSHPLKR